MRTLCDVCESAAAILFCAADEAALCSSCDDKVYGRFYVYCVSVYFVMDLIEIFSEGVNTSQIYLLDYVLLGSTILLY